MSVSMSARTLQMNRTVPCDPICSVPHGDTGKVEPNLRYGPTSHLSNSAPFPNSGPTSASYPSHLRIRPGSPQATFSPPPPAKNATDS